MLSCVRLFVKPWTAGCQTPLSATFSQSLLTLLSLDSVMQSTHPILYCPFSFCLQSFPALVFSSELALRIYWPKYWSFSFSISPSSEYSGLISFRIDLIDILAVQGLVYLREAKFGVFVAWRVSIQFHGLILDACGCRLKRGIALD